MIWLLTSDCNYINRFNRPSKIQQNFQGNVKGANVIDRDNTASIVRSPRRGTKSVSGDGDGSGATERLAAALKSGLARPPLNAIECRLGGPSCALEQEMVRYPHKIVGTCALDFCAA